jgi:Domain of unknown function (DUF4417)
MTKTEVSTVGYGYSTKSSENWQKKPGGFDSVNAKWLFPSGNAYAIPDLAPNPGLEVPKWLVPYKMRLRDEQAMVEGGLHGFLDDYRLESLWTQPTKALPYLRRFGTVVTPDFSLWRDHPYPIWLWNVYRNRWLGAFWQAHGIKVVPSVSWSRETSFKFCFLGIPQGSLVAVSSVGTAKDETGTKLFNLGFETMLAKLKPSKLLCYGKLPEELATSSRRAGVELVTYPTYWEGLKKAKAEEER